MSPTPLIRPITIHLDHDYVESMNFVLIPILNYIQVEEVVITIDIFDRCRIKNKMTKNLKEN